MTVKPTVSPPIARRAFLWTAAVAALGAVAGEWWGRRQSSAARGSARTLIRGATDLSPGAAMAFRIPDATPAGIVVRLSPDSYAAFDRRCPHLGCPVLWSVERARFECPCHKAVFDGQTGEVLQGPAARGLERLAVEIHAGALWVASAGRHVQGGKS